MKRAYGYNRSATGEKSHLELQAIRIKDYCKTENIKLVNIFTDASKSGSRPFQNNALDEMLSQCRKKDKIDAILVTATDRVSRNETDYYLIRNFLEKKGVELIVLNNQRVDKEASPMETFIDDVMKAVHTYESKVIRARQKSL